VPQQSRELPFGVLQNCDLLTEKLSDCAGPCPACSAPFKLCKPEQGVPYLSCSTAPLCRKAVYLPMAIGQADVSDQQCTQCPGIVRKVAMK